MDRLDHANELTLGSGGGSMRVLNWNIKQGGGSRIPGVCGHIREISPDLLALTEFQTQNEPSLRAVLTQLGYGFIATSNPKRGQNGLLIASRLEFDSTADQYAPDTDRERWLAVRINDLELDILVVHIPGTPDNKFDNGYGVSGAKRKELLWESVISYAVAREDRRSIIMGDLNTGLRIDAEGTMFKKSRYMTMLLGAGFVDTWRHLHPQARGYTWYSKRKDKATGKSEDLNGFRLDYIFVSPALQGGIAEVAIRHEPRIAGTSDHASVFADIDLGQESDLRRIIGRGETPSAAARNENLVNVQITSRSDIEGSPVIRKGGSSGTLRARFDLARGGLADMTCGLNGQAFVQRFRPTYVTAEWKGGVLTEVKIWGPRLLQNGSLGKRDLDHQWKRDAFSGGVNYSDLPFLVAQKLRSYLAANGPIEQLQ